MNNFQLSDNASSIDYIRSWGRLLNFRRSESTSGLISKSVSLLLAAMLLLSFKWTHFLTSSHLCWDVASATCTTQRLLDQWILDLSKCTTFMLTAVPTNCSNTFRPDLMTPLLFACNTDYLVVQSASKKSQKCWMDTLASSVSWRAPCQIGMSFTEFCCCTDSNTAYLILSLR